MSEVLSFASDYKHIRFLKLQTLVSNVVHVKVIKHTLKVFSLCSMYNELLSAYREILNSFPNKLIPTIILFALMDLPESSPLSYASVFAGYSGFLHQLQLASHNLAAILKKKCSKIPNSAAITYRYGDTGSPCRQPLCKNIYLRDELID